MDNEATPESQKMRYWKFLKNVAGEGLGLAGL